MTAFRLYAGCRMRLSRDRGDGWAARARDARSHGFDAILYLNRWEGLGPLDGFDDWAQADALSDRRFAALMPDASYSLIVLRQGVVRMLDLDESLALAA